MSNRNFNLSTGVVFSDTVSNKGTEIFDRLRLLQYENSPNLKEYINAYVAEMDILFEEIEKVYQGRFIENAMGRQLDIIGIILDEPRGINLPTQFFGFSDFNSGGTPIPFPNINKLNDLPKDKFIYSSSHNFTYNEKFIKGQYHLHHHVSGTYLFHKSLINKLVDIYKKYLNLIDKNDIWTDQVIWTLIYRDNKELFFKLCDNYASIPFYLY